MAELHPQAGSPVGEDEFYVGYLKPVPRTYARRVRASVWSLGLLSAFAAMAAAYFQADPGDAVWSEEHAELVGIFSAEPYPVLRLEGEEGGAARTLILVGAGKCGAFEPAGYCGLWGPTVPGTAEHDQARAETMKLFEGKLVRVTGTALWRGDRMMLELAQGDRSVLPAMPSPDSAALAARLTAVAQDAGEVVVSGRIVDTKCYLGAMKPGDGKTHRACAVRCISGGIPPMLVVNGPGDPAGYLLADAGGRPLGKDILRFVADAVEIRGRLWRYGDLLVLRVDPASIRRL